MKETVLSRWELHDEMYDVDHMYDKVKCSAEELKLEQTSKALLLMKKHHAGQVRKGKDRVPYIAHPLLMACHALALGLRDDDLLAATLLHDVVEDCDVTSAELDVNDKVREIVDLLSFHQADGQTKHEAKSIYFEAIKANKKAAMVKILDRCNNVSHMATAFSKEKLASYIDETEEFVYPLIDYLKKIERPPIHFG